jgi:flagellar basal body-associated protein FliL
MSLAKNHTNCFNLEHIGWKYYNTIKKKAMEQEFSWSGLLISLSIAFFIVIISAIFLSFIFNSIEGNKQSAELSNKNVYYLEKNIQTNLATKQNVKYIYINCS